MADRLVFPIQMNEVCPCLKLDESVLFDSGYMQR